MAVTASDIVIYASQEKPKNDTATAGGDINTSLRVTFTDIVATDVVELFSSDNSDSGNVVITGRNAAGILLNETIAVSGTTTVSGSQQFERIISAIYPSPSGDITLRDASTDASIGIIYNNESGFERIFYDATANQAGGDDKILYEKVFVRNNNASTALNTVTVGEVSTGLYTIIQFGLEEIKQSSETTMNRTIAPTGVNIFGDNASSGLPQDGFLTPLDYQGVWLKLTLEDGASTSNSFYRLQIDGVSA